MMTATLEVQGAGRAGGRGGGAQPINFQWVGLIVSPAPPKYEEDEAGVLFTCTPSPFCGVPARELHVRCREHGVFDTHRGFH